MKRDADQEQEAMEPGSVNQSQVNEGPAPFGEPYRPNDAFARVLAAKRALDRKTWGN
jgi:hypothetical protein